MIILFLSAVVAICVFWTLYLVIMFHWMLEFCPVDVGVFSVAAGVTFYLAITALKFVACFFFGLA